MLRHALDRTRGSSLPVYVRCTSRQHFLIQHCSGLISLAGQGGALENAALLDNAVAVAEKLAGMLEYYGFDGWLVNIEAPLPGGLVDVTRLCGFLGKLREACRKRCAMCVL